MATKTCSLCPGKHFAKGYCNRHYTRLLKYGSALALHRNIGEGSTPTERFWSRVNRMGPPHPYDAALGVCWEWLGGVSPYGYGYVTHGSTRWQTHRLAWFLLKGEEPRFLLHSCDNRRCVNPKHLREGSHADNMADMIARGRQARGNNSGRRVLDEAAAIAVINALERGVPQYKIAQRHGVARTTISSIAIGKSWKHLPRQNPRVEIEIRPALIEIHARRFDDKKNPRAEVEISEIK